MNENFARMVAEHLMTQESKEERTYVRAWVGRILALAALLVTTIYATGAYAEPFARASQGDISITLYTDPCKLQDKVSNLPHRATWQEKGKTYEGCAAANPQLGVVMLFFLEDKSVAAVPMQMFERVHGA